MAVNIFIARHGQDEDNANGILNGRRDRPLTKIGREQALALGEGIVAADIRIDAVYCSPLRRAAETARIVCSAIGLKAGPVAIPDLIERDFGIMSGQPYAKIEELCAPDIIKTDTITYFLNPEGSETFPDIITRGGRAVDEVRRRQASGNALLVCHGDLGKMIYALESGRPWQDVLTGFHFGNGDLIEITPDDKAHVVKLPQHNL